MTTLTKKQRKRIEEDLGGVIQNVLIQVADIVDEVELVNTLKLPRSTDRQRADSTDAVVEAVFERVLQVVKSYRA